MIYMYFNGVFRRVLGGGGLFIIKLFAGALRAFSRIESVLRALLFFFCGTSSICFGNGENNLYRIVSHETDGLTKITSAEPLKENGIFKNIAFGDDAYYSNTNMIGSFLNGEYLDSDSFFTEQQVNMIEDDTTWYLGYVASGASYKLSKYNDINMSDLTSTTTGAKVGLLRYGELMAGQFRASSNNKYFSLTPYNFKTNIGIITTNGMLSASATTTTLGIKPALNLKSNVIITRGDGTLQNPFELSVQ